MKSNEFRAVEDRILSRYIVCAPDDYEYEYAETASEADSLANGMRESGISGPIEIWTLTPVEIKY